MPFWMGAAMSGWLVVAGVVGALRGADRTGRALSAMLLWNGAILLLVAAGAHVSQDGAGLAFLMILLWPFIGGLLLALRH
jgi:hypothetical protein